MATSAALDQAARAQGFRDFATWQAYQHQQALMRQRANVVGQGTTAQPQAQPQQPPAAPTNWLQRLMWGLNGGH